jgi:hypothetical protein
MAEIPEGFVTQAGMTEMFPAVSRTQWRIFSALGYLSAVRVGKRVLYRRDEAVAFIETLRSLLADQKQRHVESAF